MRRVIMGLIYILFGSFPLYADEPARVFYAGTIGSDLKIHMTLEFRGDEVNGHYYYDRYKINIPLQGSRDLRDLTLNEYDPSGKMTGMFKGKIYSREGFGGTWSRPDGTKPLSFSVKMIELTGVSIIPSQWPGRWEYFVQTSSYGLDLEIKDVSSKGFKFILNANRGANIGGIEGQAFFAGDHAVWKDEEYGGELRFYLFGGMLTMISNEECSRYGGNGVAFDGDLVPMGQAKKLTLTDLGVFQNPAQEAVFKSLTKSDYQRFDEGFSSISQEEDLDGFGARVFSGWIRGVAGYYDCIVMTTPAGKIWAAVVVTEAKGSYIKYFTNDPDYSRKLPKTIEEWRREKNERFNAKLKMVFAS
jgi:hypothetical protein